MPFSAKQLSSLKLMFEKTALAESNKECVWGEDLETYTMSLFAKVSEINEKPKREKKMKDEDPDRVKRPVPASWMFRDENREQILREHFGGEKVKGSEVAKKAMELWNEMSDESQEPWVTKRQELWDAYKAANPSAKASSPKSAFDVEADEEVSVPDGWSGPFASKYLTGYANGRARGVGKFQSFAEAYEAGKDMAACGGITYDRKGGYQLRVGCDPISIPSSGDYTVSWTKEDHTVVVGPKKTRAKKGNKISVEDEVSPDAQAKIKKELCLADADAEDGRVTPDIARCLDEEQTTEDEDEEEDMEVTPWEYKGVTYLLDEKTGDVYDYDEQELVGKKTKAGKFIKIN